MAAAMNWTIVRTSAAAAMLLAAGAAPPPAPPLVQYRQQMFVREQIIVRFPGRFSPASEAPVRWKERRGPKCIPARMIAGAALPGDNKVDLVLRDRSRVRALLDRDCPALDYYMGLYITSNPDGMICADRDIIRSRVGGQCAIDKFRRLKPR
jgi:hypothetical protein